MKNKLMKLACACFFLAVTAAAHAAVGCDLNDPDRDVKRLFPESSGYNTSYVSLDKIGGDKMLAEVEKRLGDKFKGLYETVSVPYTLYEIRKNKDIIGYIHGVNQKGVYGGIQVFLALDKTGTIKAFYIQKLTSKQAARLRSAAFADKFAGLSLKDFNTYDVAAAGFKSGAPDSLKGEEWGDADLRAVMRAVKKNLILMDEFVFKNMK
jgi:hypothetical protein